MAFNSKTMKGLTTDSTLDTAKFTPQMDSNGKTTLIKNSTMMSGGASTLIGTSVDDLGGYSPLQMCTEGVFITCHRAYTNTDNYPLMIKPDKWISGYASKGERAEAVAIVEGGHVLLVATEEAPTTLLWSSAAVSGGGTTTSDRVTALADWNGKSNTAAQIAKSSDSAITNTAEYAPGFCNLYSIVNDNGKGMTAGRWWLPSLAEMMMIFANMRKINYALSVIAAGGQDATLLSESAYWTSTEGSSTYAWFLFLSHGFMYYNAKATYKYRVRPVSAFLN